jgi:phage-related protein
MVDLLSRAPDDRRRAFEAVGSSLKDLAGMPLKVRRAFGGALRAAQNGAFPEDSRPFGEGLPREIMKLVENQDGDTYRAAYVIAFPECVYLLHAFKKKASSGKETPQPDKQTIEARFKAAKLHYEQNYRSKGGDQ